MDVQTLVNVPEDLAMARAQFEAFCQNPVALDDNGELVSVVCIDGVGIWGKRGENGEKELVLSRDSAAKCGSSRPEGMPEFVLLFGATFEPATLRAGEEATSQRTEALARENGRRALNVTPAWRRFREVRRGNNGTAVIVPNVCQVHSASPLCWAGIQFEIPENVTVTGLGVIVI